MKGGKLRSWHLITSALSRKKLSLPAMVEGVFWRFTPSPSVSKELCWKYIWSLNNLGNVFRNYHVLSVAHKEEQSKGHSIPSRWASGDNHRALLSTDIGKRMQTATATCLLTSYETTKRYAQFMGETWEIWVESVCLPVIWVSADASPEFIIGDSPRTEHNAFLLLSSLSL